MQLLIFENIIQVFISILAEGLSDNKLFNQKY